MHIIKFHEIGFVTINHAGIELEPIYQAIMDEHRQLRIMLGTCKFLLYKERLEIMIAMERCCQVEYEVKQKTDVPGLEPE